MLTYLSRAGLKLGIQRSRKGVHDANTRDRFGRCRDHAIPKGNQISPISEPLTMVAGVIGFRTQWAKSRNTSRAAARLSGTLQRRVRAWPPHRNVCVDENVRA